MAISALLPVDVPELVLNEGVLGFRGALAAETKGLSRQHNTLQQASAAAQNVETGTQNAPTETHPKCGDAQRQRSGEETAVLSCRLAERATGLICTLQRRGVKLSLGD